MTNNLKEIDVISKDTEDNKYSSFIDIRTVRGNLKALKYIKDDSSIETYSIEKELKKLRAEIRNINIHTEPFSDARSQTMECYKKVDSFISDFQLKFNK